MNKTKLNPQQRGYKKAVAGVIITGAAAFSMEYCLQPVISKIAVTFLLNPAQASIAVSAAMLGMALTLLVLTSFTGQLPRRKMLAGSLAVSSLVLFTAGMVQSFAAVVALRFVQGCILALVPVLSMAYVNEEFAPENTGFGIGMYVCGTTLGGLSGRILTSILTDYTGWQHAVMCLSLLTVAAGAAVWFLLPQEHNYVRKHSKGFNTEIFAKENKKLFLLCSAAFFMMGSFVSVYNFITYVLTDAPYNLSQSVIGFLFAVQLFGTFSSAAAGKFTARYGSGSVISFCLLLLAAGAGITVHHLLVIKIIGLAILTIGLFGAHASASGWCGQLVKNGKAAAGSLYMFCYYSGASILGSLGGIFYSSFGWGGVAAMSALAALLAFAVVRLVMAEHAVLCAGCKN